MAWQTPPNGVEDLFGALLRKIPERSRTSGERQATGRRRRCVGPVFRRNSWSRRSRIRRGPLS
jgi:hypothetical protein